MPRAAAIARFTPSMIFSLSTGYNNNSTLTRLLFDCRSTTVDEPTQPAVMAVKAVTDNNFVHPLFLKQSYLALTLALALGFYCGAHEPGRPGNTTVIKERN